MTATYAAEHLKARSERRLVDFDPDSAAESWVTLDPANTKKCLAVALYRRFLVGLMHSVGTGSITSFKLYAATDADGTGAVAIVAHALGSDPNAVGDTLWLECDIEQVREVLSTATHIGAKITLGTSTDECVVAFERASPQFPAAGLTADYVS
jgi:hypothetical protein